MDRKKVTKRLMIVVKVAVALVLLAWVLSMTHWNDYVQARPEFGGQTWTMSPVGEDGKQYVQRGLPWNVERKPYKPAEYEPVPGEGDNVVRRGFASSLKSINRGLFALALLGFVIPQFIVAIRWWTLLRAQSIGVSLWESIRLTFLGLFFNMVVPGTVGGDMVKAWYVSKHTHHTAAALVSIFVDRIVGLIGMALIAAIMLFAVVSAGMEELSQMKEAAMAVGAVMLLLVMALGFLLSRRLRRWFHVQKFYQKLSIAHHIQAAGQAALVYRKRPVVLLKALGMTLCAHACMFGSIAILGFALGLDTPFYRYLVYLPLIYIIGSVPVTPGGVGLVENLYVKFFASATVGASAIIALAMLARLIPVFWSIPGLFVAITGPKLPKADELQAELEKAEQQEQEA